MIRIHCIVIGFQMTAGTGIGCVGVIALMALVAIFPDRHMRSIKDKELVVDIKSGRRPAGRSCVAGSAIRRKSDPGVTGILGLIKISTVAIHTN